MFVGRMKLRLNLLLFAFVALPVAAQVRIISSNGVKAAIEELRPQLQNAAAQPVRVDYATSASQAQKIQASEPFDIAILTNDLIDALIKAGKLSPNGRAALGKAGVGVGIRKGAKHPDISTADAFKRTLLAAKSITYAGDGASRVTLEKAFAQMGIADALNSKTILEQGSTRATARVANGDAELVLTLVSEIMPAPGVELVGEIPAAFQTYTGFSAALAAKGSSPAAAAALKFLSSAAVAPVLKSKGL